MYFYEIARRTGIDHIAAMANRLGVGVDLPTDLPGARKGLIPTRAWRMGKGKAWNIGDTIVSGIGQGFVQVTPMQLTPPTPRASPPGAPWCRTSTRKVGGALQPEARPESWPFARPAGQGARAGCGQGMWAVVNDAGGTAPIALHPGPSRHAGGQDRLLAGAPRVARGCASTAFS